MIFLAGEVLRMSIGDFMALTPAVFQDLLEAAVQWRSPQQERQVIKVRYADECGW